MRRITASLALLALSAGCAPEGEAPEVVALVWRTVPDEPYPFRRDGLGPALRVVELDEQLRAEADLAGRPLRLALLDADSDAPRLEVNGRTQGLQYQHQEPGYARASTWLQLGTGDQRPEEYLLIGATGDDWPRIVLMPLGARRGFGGLKDGEQHELLLHDWDADGVYENDELFVDADGNGRFARCERLKAGEPAVIGELRLELVAVEPTGESVTLRQTRAEPGSSARDLLAELTRAPLPGNALPEGTLRLADGTDLDLSSLRGRPFVLDFTAWNGGSEQDRDLRELLSLVAPEEVPVVAIQQQPELGREAVPDWLWAEPSPELHEACWVLGLPTAILVDAEGRIVTRRLSGWEEVRERNLALLQQALESAGG